jgi:hypothetical protein
MKKLISGLVVAAATAAVVVPLAVAGGGNSDAANACKQGGWQNVVREDGTGFKNQGDCVSYAAKGGVPKAKPAAAPNPIAVSAPMFNLDVNTCSVTVPYTPGIDTFLYGVNGRQETPITAAVTVTGGLDGAPDTAGQFWIGYTPKPGYVITGAAPTHFDFYNGDNVRDCVSSATGDVTWNFQGSITGTVKFDAKATGGSLHYTNSNGQWLEGVVTSYRQIDDHTAVFAGTITDGSDDYTINHEGADYFFAKVVDGGTPGSNGDQIAVLANAGFDPALGAAGNDYDMSLGSGIVTAGNLVVH